MPVCPADGCDYSGPKDSVAAHYSGSKDDKHDGGYEWAKTKIETQSSDGSGGSDPSDSLEDDPDVDDPDGGDGLGIPGDEGGDDGDGEDLPESCPDCGGDLQVLPEDTAFQLDSGVVGRTDEGDARCIECEALVTADGEVFE